MSTTIAQVQNVPVVRSAEFVKLTISVEGEDDIVHTFSTSYRHEIVDGVDYSPLGGLLGIGEQHRDLRVTSFDTAISLSGVDPNQFQSENIYIVLNEQIRGSQVEIYRGFYDDDYTLSNFVPRFKGIVTGYNVSEQRERDQDMFNITINCSSYKMVLENNVGGRRTNSVTWKYWYNGQDTSMDNIEKLSGAYFDFGGKPSTTKTTANNSSNPNDNNTYYSMENP
jgi:hypothetical protein